MRTFLVAFSFLFYLFVPRAAAENKPIPNFNLTDQNGRAFPLHDLKGRYVFLSFVYSRCPMPDMCPLTMKLSRDLIEKWKAQSPMARTGFPLKVLAVTLDPQYDTPAVLKKYMESQHLDPELFTFATGDPKVLSDLAAEFNIVGFPSGDGTVSHNVKSVLISPVMVPLREYKDNQWTPDQVLTDMRRSVAWWKWFFVASALLALPGILLLLRLRRYRLDAQT